MGIRLISSVTGLVTLDVYLQSLLSSNGPLFYLASDNLIINIVLLLLSFGGIALAFRGRFKSWYGYAACAAAAAAMVIFGAAGVLFGTVIYSLWDTFAPLNYLLLLQDGIVMAVCCLAFQHAKRPRSAMLPTFSALVSKLKFVLPVPKSPHFPQVLSRESASGTN